MNNQNLEKILLAHLVWGLDTLQTTNKGQTLINKYNISSSMLFFPIAEVESRFRTFFTLQFNYSNYGKDASRVQSFIKFKILSEKGLWLEKSSFSDKNKIEYFSYLLCKMMMLDPDLRFTCSEAQQFLNSEGNAKIHDHSNDHHEYLYDYDHFHEESLSSHSTEYDGEMIIQDLMDEVAYFKHFVNYKTEQVNDEDFDAVETPYCLTDDYEIGEKRILSKLETFNNSLHLGFSAEVAQGICHHFLDPKHKEECENMKIELLEALQANNFQTSLRWSRKIYHLLNQELDEELYDHSELHDYEEEEYTDESKLENRYAYHLWENTKNILTTGEQKFAGEKYEFRDFRNWKCPVPLNNQADAVIPNQKNFQFLVIHLTESFMVNCYDEVVGNLKNFLRSAGQTRVIILCQREDYCFEKIFYFPMVGVVIF